MKVFNTRYYEWIVYIILWVVLWMYPLLAMVVVSMKGDMPVSWHSVFLDWGGIFPFFLLFLLHRAPVHFLFMRHHVRAYIFSVIGLLCIFGVWCYYSGADDFSTRMSHGRDPLHHESTFSPHPFTDMDEVHHEGLFPANRAPVRPPLAVGRGLTPGRPPFKPVILELVIATLMLGFDLAIAIFFRYQDELEKVRRLETEHLRYQLEHLKSQVNPHFLMNMLHSIHGMVELKPAKAQVMIMELSRLMRYVLYESDKLRTSLQKETDFINNYVELMRKRYPSHKVDISLELPDRCQEHIFLPPLLFINIIENAFKHGISYQNPSFVKIKLSIEDDKLHMNCRNSNYRRPAKDGSEEGVGLSNLRQRLQLLYGSDFVLETAAVDGMAYNVELIIPYENDNDTMYCG